jgi:hypothetical protein
LPVCLVTDVVGCGGFKKLKVIMKTITVKEALEQGYTLCGYEDLEMQSLKNIDNLEEEDFEPHYGYLCVANKESNSASISSEELTEWLTDRYYDTEGNPDDDTKDMELCFKEKTDIIDEFVSKMNEVYQKKKWWFLDSDLRLVPDKTEF